MIKKEAIGDEKSIQNENQFRKQIKVNFIGMINIDTQRTYEILQEFMDDQHEELIESITGHGEEQLKYLDAMLTTDHAKIQNYLGEYYTFSKNKEQATKYIQL